MGVTIKPGMVIDREMEAMFKPPQLQAVEKYRGCLEQNLRQLDPLLQLKGNLVAKNVDYYDIHFIGGNPELPNPFAVVYVYPHSKHGFAAVQTLQMYNPAVKSAFEGLKCGEFQPSNGNNGNLVWHATEFGKTLSDFGIETRVRLYLAQITSP